MADGAPPVFSKESACQPFRDKVLLPKPPATPPASPVQKGSPASRRITRINRAHGRDTRDLTCTDEQRTPSPANIPHNPDESPASNVSSGTPRTHSTEGVDDERTAYFPDGTNTPDYLRYSSEDLRIQIPDDMDTSDEEIHRLTCRKRQGMSDSESSDDLSPEDVIKLSELEAARNSAHREVEMFLLRADIQSRSDRSNGVTPSPSGDEMWSSGIYTEAQLDEASIRRLEFVQSKHISKDQLPYSTGAMANTSKNPNSMFSECRDQNDEYYHRMVPMPLPPQNTENAKERRRYRRLKHRLNPKMNRLSDPLTRYSQYQNIWADIYEQQDMIDYSAMADLDPNGPQWLQGYTAPLVCPVPGEIPREQQPHTEEYLSDTSDREVNPIIQAVLNEDAPSLLDCLGKSEGDINAPIDDGGWTALHFAVRFSNHKLCKILLEHGANLESQDAIEHWTPLHVAAMTSEIAPDILQLLLEHQCDRSVITQTDCQGRTALHLCFLSMSDKLAEKELDALMNQGVVDDFHYFLLKAGLSEIETPACKTAWEQEYSSCENNSDNAEQRHSEMVNFPASDSQHTLTGDIHADDELESILKQLCHPNAPALLPVSDDLSISEDISDDNESQQGQGYDPDSSSGANDADQKVPLNLPLHLLQDSDTTLELTSQISFPIYTIPEENVDLMTARFVTTTHTFRQDDQMDDNREVFEYESDTSSIEECVAVLEAFDLSPDEDGDGAMANIVPPMLPTIKRKIELLLDNGFSVVTEDGKGFSALHYAVWIDSTHLIKSLVPDHIDMRTLINSEKQTILHIAALAGNIDIITCLLENGLDVNQLDQYFNSPVDIFIMEHLKTTNHVITPWLRSKEVQSRCDMSHCLRLLEVFCDRGAVVSSIASIDHLLNIISIDKLEEMVRNGPKFFDFTARNFQQQTLLHVASMKTYDERQIGLITMNIGFLVENDISVNAKDINGRTALHLACWQRNKILVKALLMYGADSKAHDKFDQTSLHYTVMEMRQVLPNWYDFSAFHVALTRSVDPMHSQKLIQEQLDILDLLLAHNGDIHQKDCHGRTVLHRAASDCDKLLAEHILTQGGDLYAADSNDLTPATYIVKLHRKDLFHLTYSPDTKTKHGADKCKDLPPFRRPIVPAIEEQQDNTEIDVLEQVRQFRGNVDKFTRKLLTTPGIGHVRFEDENANIRADVFLLMQRLSTALGNIDPRFASSVHIVGSVREDTKVGQANGFDYVFELTQFKDVFEIDSLLDPQVQQSSVISLKLKQEVIDNSISLKPFCDNEGVLHGATLGVQFSSAVLKALSEPDLWTGLSFLWEDELELGSNFITFPCMLQLRWMGSKYRDMLLDVDIVPAVCIKTPKLQECVQISRKKSTVNFSPTCSTVLIKWEGDMANDSHLQLSFAEAEIHVMDNIPGLIKSGYRLGKIIYNSGLCHQMGSGIDAYLLKTVLLWLLYPEGEIGKVVDTSWICPIDDERQPRQTVDNWTEIRWVAYHLFDRLESHLYSQYLASFFMPGQNLVTISGKSMDSMINMCMAAKALLSDPQCGLSS